MTDQKKDQYAMYLRKSRADMELEAMGEEETLSRHKAMLFSLAARHEIHPDQITIYHEVVSGDSIDSRPEMQRLLADVYAKTYKGVLVVEVERLARGNTKDQGEVADAFQASNTNIITPAKVYDPNNEFDQEYFEFGLFMSRREYKTIKRRLEAGKKQSVIEGNYILPQRIFGYDIVRRSKKDRTLTIREDEAKYVHMIFDWYTEEKLSTGMIARKLSLMSVPTIKGKSEWNKGTIRDMLANPTYIGKVQWGKRHTVKEFDSELGKLIKVVKNDGTSKVYDGKHQGIITKEQFEKARIITEQQHQPKVKLDHEIINPFAGIMKCCDCGRNIIAITYTDGRKTRLAHARDTICQKASLPMDQVVEAVVEALKASIDDCEMKMESNSNKEEIEKHKALIESMESELEKLERKRRKLFQAYEDDVYSRDEFIERKQHYNESIEKLKKQIQEQQKAVPEPVDFSEKIVSLHDMIDCIQNPEISAQKKNIFLKQFISHITFDSVSYGRKKGGIPVLEVFFK